MQPSGRRKVSSCIPCYTRKQKCNRQNPCDHCTRRRRPEDCAYYPSDDIEAASNQRNALSASVDVVSYDLIPELDSVKGPATNGKAMPSSLTDVFGYSEDSQANTIALVRRIEQVDEDDQSHRQGLPAPSDLEIQERLDKIPDGLILDFLVKYFVREVNWMDQLVHLPWFLSQYQIWRTVKVPSSVFEMEFAVLTLRICSYTSEFLPSPSCTIEKIRGKSLANIRHSCDEAADSLSELCLRLDSKGSLLRVQHMAFSGLKAKCEGRMNDFRDTLRSTIQVAQTIGADQDASRLARDMGELEKETRRRVFCNLYIWDSHLSRQLDRLSTIRGALEQGNMPCMHLGPDCHDAPGLEEFTERILQVRLANFWKSMGPTLGSTYDMLVTEERYERLCSEFLSALPSAFALQPDKKWDDRLPMLSRQREILYISIFESLCNNFRPVFLLEANQVQVLPQYKQIFLSSQRKALAVAALYVLKGVSRLHSLIGGSHTRYTGIIQPTFEAAVILVSLCVDPGFLAQGEVEDHSPRVTKVGPLRAGTANLRREDCIKAIRNALGRLQMLAEASHMADVGAQTLAKLICKVARQPEGAEDMDRTSTPASRGSSTGMTLPESLDLNPAVSLAALTSVAAFDIDMNMDWDALASSL